MALHFAKVCCEDAEGNDYPFPCCPSVSVTCESEERVVTLCGFSQYEDSINGVVVLSPPVKFKKRRATLTELDWKSERCRYCDSQSETDGDTNELYSLDNSGEIVDEYLTVPNDCSISSTLQDVEVGVTMYICGTDIGSNTISFSPAVTPQNVIDSGDTFNDGSPYDGLRKAEAANISGGSQTATFRRIYSGTYSLGTCGNGDTVESYRYYTLVTTLSEMDSEEDALLRATETSGASCSSLWETRSTGFEFIKRTSEYTLNIDNLISGLSYRVKPIIRRRTAVIGSYGEWEDVTTSWHSFVASSGTHTIGSVALTHVQGYEYQVTDAIVEGVCSV